MFFNWEFQFLLVQLKEFEDMAIDKAIEISIPSGSIKSM